MVGNILRQERERKNLSVQDIEAETGIRVLYITSIEEENYEVIPGEVYLRGFIKTYAKFLQLDGVELLQAYDEEKVSLKKKADLPESVAAPENAAETKSAVKPERAMQQEKTAAAPKNLREPLGMREKRVARKQEMKMMRYVAIGATVLLCAGSGYWAFSDESAPEQPKAVSVQTEQKAAPVKPPEKPAAKPVEQPPVQPAAKPVVQPLEIQVKYSGNCWTQVKADGNVIYERTAQSGAVLSWKAEKQLEVTFGNAGAAEIISGGQSLGRPGNNGEVVTKTFAGSTGAPVKQ